MNDHGKEQSHQMLKFLRVFSKPSSECDKSQVVYFNIRKENVGEKIDTVFLLSPLHKDLYILIIK